MTAKPRHECLTQSVGIEWLMDNECATDPVLGHGGETMLCIVLLCAEDLAKVILVVDGEAAFVFAPLASVVNKMPGG